MELTTEEKQIVIEVLENIQVKVTDAPKVLAIITKLQAKTEDSIPATTKEI